MKNKLSLALLAGVGLVAATVTPVSAAVVIGSTPGGPVYVGPTPTYNFDTPTPFSGLITSTSESGVRARPFGSTGNFASVGPDDGSPEILDLSAFGVIESITLLWGSVDTYNTLDVFDLANNLMISFTGSQVVALANGNQTDPFTNPLVTLTFSGLDQTKVGSLRFSSSSNAFEFDNVTVATAVPEPAAWITMILGFGLIGGLARRRNSMKAMA
jgi:PEP-CTERM motif